MAGHLYALDFDGVLCDSCGESSVSAVKAATIRWPELFGQLDSAVEGWIVDKMHILRPVVETGYENVLLVRLLAELRIPEVGKSSVAAGLTIESILENWPNIKTAIMGEWNVDRESLIDLFGKVRDEWIEKDLAGWIGANRLYPGIADALKFASSQVYIVTTKQDDWEQLKGEIKKVRRDMEQEPEIRDIESDACGGDIRKRGAHHHMEGQRMGAAPWG